MSAAADEALPADAVAVLEHWFGPAALRGGALAPRERLWFRADAADDEVIRERFGSLIEPAAAGDLDGWARTAHGSLALVVVLDQFPRNVHRRTRAAFACDSKARAVCEDGLERGLDRALGPLERTFYYLPLQHAEDRVAQARAVALYAALAREPSGATAAYLEKTAGYARAHRDIVERFGRFPHRNAVLGRVATPEETAWLEAGGATFGQ